MTSDDVVTKVLGARARCREASRPPTPARMTVSPKSSSRSRASSSAPAGWWARCSPASTARCSGGRGWSSPRCAPTSRATTSARSTGTSRRASASPYVKTFTEERELTLMLLVDQSGSTRFGEPLTKAALAVEVAAVLALAAARPERPGRRAALRRRGRAGDPAAARAGATRSGSSAIWSPSSRPAGAPTWPPACPTPAGCCATGASSWCSPTSSPRAGSGRFGGSPPGTRSSRSRWTTPASTSCPNRAGSRCWTRRPGRRVLVDTGQPRGPHAGWASSRARAARSGAARSPRPGADQVHLETGVPYALPLRRAFAQRARRIRRA